MRLAALFSGGKDSTYAVYLAERLGYEVPILLTVNPASEESYYFHYPNVWVTRMQAEAMGKIHVMTRAGPKRDDELRALGDLVDKVSGKVDGLLSGVIRSRAQYESFKELCDKRGLKFVTPLWNREPMELLEQMLIDNFEIMIVGVAAEGLKKEILGKTLDKMLLNFLKELFEKYGVSPAGEGGEMETLVIDAPIFRKRIRVLDYEVHWSGFSGFIDIKGVELIEK
ncbi:MAG: diphthine--ammonia ligase [Aigarchaeota archaeon]|nr:diphthine--ammonia ligase [Aigarchaeota archaeon]